MNWSGAFGLAGIVVGIAVSYFAHEELKSGAKYFKFIRNGIFSLFVAFFLFTHFGIVWMIIGLLALSVVMRTLSEKNFTQTIPLAFAVMWIWSQSELMTGLFFLTALFEGGLWSSRHKLRSTRKKGKSSCGLLLKKAIRDHWWYALALLIQLVA